MFLLNYLRGVFLLTILLLLFACPCSALRLSADKAILLDASSGDILYEKDADAPAPPASTTKLMTALVALECGIKADDMFEVSHAAVSVGGSSLYLQAGERVDGETLLYGLLLESANDAAVVLAEGLCETEADFVRRMNEKAAELGMTETHFENPHGMPAEGHLSSAADLARLMCAASQNARLMELLCTQTYSSGSRFMTNHNKLLERIPACDGGKTGYTKAAGRCLVSTAVICGRRYVAVTLDDPDDWDDHGEMYAYAENLQTTVFFSYTDISRKLPVAGGGELLCTSVGGIRISVPVYLKDKLEVSYELPRFVYPGICRGTQIGTAKIIAGGCVSSAVSLYAAEDAYLPVKAETVWSRICSYIFGWLQ